MTTQRRNRLFAILILCFPFMVLVGFLISESTGPLPPLPPLPDPNGYDDLVKAGRMVSSNSWNFENLDAGQLRATASANAMALALAQAALSNQCQVPLQYSPAYSSNHVQDLVALRSLAKAFAAAGRLAEMEGQFNVAAQSDLDTIHLGVEAGRGGTVIDGMVGIAIESFGLKPLQNISGRLDAQTCRQTARTVEILQGQRSTWTNMLQQDDVWSRRTFGWRGPWLKWIHASVRKRNFQRAIGVINSTQHDESRLVMDLAARAYELEKGHPPANSADLVPDYLKIIPSDPITGKQFELGPPPGRPESIPTNGSGQ